MSKIVLAFILTYLGGICATLFIDVSWGIYLYQIEYFVNPRSRWWGKHLPDFRYTFVIAMIILLSYIARYQHFSENRFFEVPQAKWFLLNAINFALISFWAVWPMMHYKTLKVHFKLLVFLFIAYKTINTPSKFEKMIWCFLFGNFYLGWVGHGKGRTHGTMGRMEGFGPTDSGGDGNNTALILISCMPLLLYYVAKGKKWQKLLAILFMVYVLDAVVLVNSRGAFVGLIISFAYLIMLTVFFSEGLGLKERLIVLGGVFIGGILFVYMTDAIFWTRMASLEGATENATAGGGRKMFWAKAVELVSEYPFGVGTWGYQFLSPQFIPEEYLTKGRRAVHSLYFQCLAERGYIGTFFFGGLILSNFLFLRKIKRYLKYVGNFDLFYLAVALEASFIAYLAGSVFLNRLHAEVLYWLMMFIACFGNIYMLKGHGQKKILKRVLQS